MAAVFVVVCQGVALVLGLKAAREGRIDLRAFYAAGVILRSGQGAELYNYELQQHVQDATVSYRSDALPFLYPAFAALPFVPLSMLAYKTAWVVWFGVNVALLLVVAWMLARRLRAPAIHWPGLLLLFGCILGVSVALIQGQISVLLLLVFVSAWTLVEQERSFWAGMVLALALMKFQIALPVALLLLVWRQVRMMAGFACGAVLLALLSLGMVGRSGAALYVHSMTTMTAQTALHANAAHSHYGMFPTDMPNLHGLFFGLSHGAPWGLALTAIASCCVLLWAAREGRTLVTALPASMLVSYHMQPHDLTLLLLPLSVLLARWTEGRLRGAARYAVVGSVCLLTLPLAGVLMVRGISNVGSIAVALLLFAVAKSEVTA